MRELSAQYPRYGYRRIRIFLGRDGMEDWRMRWVLCPLPGRHSFLHRFDHSCILGEVTPLRGHIEKLGEDTNGGALSMYAPFAFTA
jgi:hypothetical protein